MFLTIPIIWDETKRQTNLTKHKVDFASVENIDTDSFFNKTEYRSGESRYESYVLIADRLHVMIWSVGQEALRLISLRKANDREYLTYLQDKGQTP